MVVLPCRFGIAAESSPWINCCQVPSALTICHSGICAAFAAIL
jgi:hypothetical protein